MIDALMYGAIPSAKTENLFRAPPENIFRKLNNEDFLSKAPAQVVAKVKEKHTAIIEKQQKLKINLDKIKKI